MGRGQIDHSSVAANNFETAWTTVFIFQAHTKFIFKVLVFVKIRLKAFNYFKLACSTGVVRWAPISNFED